MQSTFDRSDQLHVALIMDGNGRWATRKGLPRTLGHHAGLRSARHIIEVAPSLGVGTLTLFAFSSDNWRRPKKEVDVLMSLAKRYLTTEKQQLIDRGVLLTVVGRRDRLPLGLSDEINLVEKLTADGRSLHLRIALDYSSRDAIIRAATSWSAATLPTQEQFRHLVSGSDVIDVDLVIRSGGEKRLSDFLLWESAYAELLFTDKMWPDFSADDFRVALAEFHRRDRRYGGLVNVA
jgi:undecaprenyl diphosphate synthase